MPLPLVVLSCRPEAKHAGSVYTEKALQQRPKDSYLWISQPDYFPSKTLWPLNATSQWKNSVAPFRSGLRHFYHSKVTARTQATWLLRVCKMLGAEKLWILLHADTWPLYLAAAFASLEEDKPKLYLSIHDPPDRASFDYPDYYGHQIRRYINLTLKKALAGSVSVGTASEPMADLYRAEHGVDSEILIMGNPDAESREPTQLSDNGEFHLAFAGSAYTERNWQALVRALDQADWVINDRQITIHFLGLPPQWLPKRPQIIQHGWLDSNQVLPTIAKFDAAYLPYWLEPELSSSVKYCFPSKMGTYLAAGLPVLFHGPQDSSPAQFIERYPAAEVCSSYEEAEIQACIGRLTESEIYLRMTVQCELAVKQELSQAVFLERVARFLGC